MLEYLKANLIAIIALLISLAGFGLSFKNYLKSNVNLKISSNPDSSYCLGFMWYEKYKLIVIDLTIENKSTSAVDISRIRLIDNTNIYLASTISIEDRHNPNGISLLSLDENSYIRINITSDNILNVTRIPSYGTTNGYAVFKIMELITEPKSYTLIVDTPYKSFKAKVLVNLCPEGFKPIVSLDN